jgi:hypothetical protein
MGRFAPFVGIMIATVSDAVTVIFSFNHDDGGVKGAHNDASAG